MAIDAKQSFISQVEHRCADRLTMTDMNGLMAIISDVLQGFRMEEMACSAWDMTEDDLLEAFMASLQVQGRSGKTIRRYRYVIDKFMTYAKTPTRSVNVYHVRKEWKNLRTIQNILLPYLWAKTTRKNAVMCE